MKLFVWQGQGVLQDWSSGMIVAIAKDLGAALALAATDPIGEELVRDMATVTPEVIDLPRGRVEPRLWYVSGGG